MKRVTWVLFLLASCSGPLPQFMQDAPKTEEDAGRIIKEIEKELGDSFIVEQVDTIFFVASNDGRSSTSACRGTISRMYKFLTTEFFSKKPEKPIRVYLFRNKKTYSDYCKETYGSPPSTPFGFYMSDERKMVMNIATGRGTLAHELVHPLLATDFPEVPAWFNEGFASLYEQCRGTRAGRMIGLVNWRLPALQKALRSEEGVRLKDILSTTSSQFYGEDRGVNYGAARYLCFYLQERGLLRKFYREFKKTFEDDKTGMRALEKVTETPLDKLQERWAEWVQDLSYDD